MHCSDTVFLGHILSSVHIAFQEIDIRIFLCELFKRWSDSVTWTTPNKTVFQNRLDFVALVLEVLTKWHENQLPTCQLVVASPQRARKRTYRQFGFRRRQNLRKL